MKYTDVTNQRFGRLIAQKYVSNGKWKCLCDCGKTTITTITHLLRGDTRSCGCLAREQSSLRRQRPYNTKSRLYHIWIGMKYRCLNPHAANYERYGALGIGVCDEWKDSYQAFENWARNNGYSENLTIDRINSQKDYSPNNCRWATAKTQANNRRSNRFFTRDGITKSAKEWSQCISIPYEVMMQRIRKGWDIEKAMTVPVAHRSRRKQNDT